MKPRIAINGFGRIGRLVLRAAVDAGGFNFVHINDPFSNAETSAHLLEFDTVHGRWDRGIHPEEGGIVVSGKRLDVSQKEHLSDVDWSGVDIVLECSGRHRTREALQPYFDAGVKKVIVAAPVKEGVLNVVIGCNDQLYDASTDHIVTAASCTTNCIAPVVKVMHEQIGIRHGMITTMHDLTNTQTIVDAPHPDLRRARSAVNSLIPTTTGSATAIGLIFPELQGKLDGLAVRVPLLNASLTDCVFELSRAVTVEEVNSLLRAAAEDSLKGILGYEERPLVSADFTNDPRSVIVDALSTRVVNGTQVKLLVWYDNEWGYSMRMMELAKKVAERL